MEEEEPCNDCVNAAEAGDGTWLCLSFTRYVEDGTFYVSLIDSSVDFDNCPEYLSPEEDAALDDEDEEEEEKEEFGWDA